LRITTKDGETVLITFYWTGQNPPAFTDNGVDYFYGGGVTEEEGHAVDGGIRAGQAIVAAYSESRTRKNE
jgi:hypothetical protein